MEGLFKKEKEYVISAIYSSPKVDVHAGITLTALVDTGANISLVSEEAFNQIP